MVKSDRNSKGGGGGGGLLYISNIGTCGPKGYGFCDVSV